MAASDPNPTYMTPGTPPQTSNSSTSTKPTLLAFHGSGSNATVHTVQLARLMRVIKPHFSVESLDAPFPSAAGPGVLPFFDGCGPFKRWLPPSEKVSLQDMKEGNVTDLMPVEVEELVRNTVRRIKGEGGKVVGLIGFSQGTKVTAGLLRACEILRTLDIQEEEGLDWLDFPVGVVSVCGSYPPPLLPPSLLSSPSFSKLPESERKALIERKIQSPVFHVQGKKDGWNWAGMALIERHFEEGEGKSVVRAWENGHHYPVATQDSEEVGNWMVERLKMVEGAGEGLGAR